MKTINRSPLFRKGRVILHGRMPTPTQAIQGRVSESERERELLRAHTYRFEARSLCFFSATVTRCSLFSSRGQGCTGDRLQHYNTAISRKIYRALSIFDVTIKMSTRTGKAIQRACRMRAHSRRTNVLQGRGKRPTRSGASRDSSLFFSLSLILPYSPQACKHSNII